MVCDVHTTSFSKKEEEKATHDTYHRELGVPCLLPYTLYTYKLEIVPIAVIIRGRESGAVMSRRRPAAAIVSSSSWLCHHGRHTTTIRKEQRSVNILGILLISLLLIHARKVNAFCLRNSQRRSSTIPTFSATEVDHDDLMVDNLQPHLVFPGGGIFFYWQAGVVSYLREQQYDLSCCTFAGASAGALTATLTSTGVDFYQATDRALELAAEAGVWDRKGGLQGIWGPIIEQWLDELLPPEAETIVQGKLSLLVTPIPSFGKTQVNDFQDRQDLIRCNMASVHLVSTSSSNVRKYHSIMPFSNRILNYNVF